MKGFVLVGDEQVPVSPQDVAGVVKERGWKRTAEYYGFSESTLRKFLGTNHYVVQTVLVRVPPPGEAELGVTQELPSVG